MELCQLQKYLQFYLKSLEDEPKLRLVRSVAVAQSQPYGIGFISEKGGKMNIIVVVTKKMINRSCVYPRTFVNIVLNCVSFEDSKTAWWTILP